MEYMTESGDTFTKPLLEQHAVTEADKHTKITDLEVKAQLAWTPEIDTMLTNWCDQAKCFEWMHTETFSMYDKFTHNVLIVTHVLNTLSGMSTIAAGTTEIYHFKMIWLFGSVSIFVSLINVLQEKLGYGKQAVLHKNYASTWGIIRRKIESVVSIPVSSRKDCYAFLKYVREEIDRVSVEGNLAIPAAIRLSCYKKFKDVPNFIMPDICGEMVHTVSCVSN